jgi:fermentation-respiration switch protein FrsA (DUF1100 family)
VAWIVVIGFGAATAVLYFAQSSLVYFPTREIVGTPTDLGLDSEEVTLTTADGVEITGWYVPATRQPAVVLLCHGNGGNISHRLDLIETYHRLGLGSFVFDYRGYGMSSGSPDEEGTYEDARAAWRYLTEEQGLGPEDIVVHGRSLGGPIAARLATEVSPGGLIIDSSFTSIIELGQEHYPFLPVRLLSKFEYPTARYVSNLAVPLLVMHSPSDEIVPYHHGQDIFDAGREPKRFLRLAGGHNDSYLVAEREYAEGLSRFVADRHELRNAAWR